MKLAAGKIDLAQFTAPAAEGAPADEPLDLSALGLLDANVDFTAEEIVSGDMALRNLGLDVKLAGGVLETGVRSVEINGAPGSGTVVIDARNAEPAVSGTVKMSGLDLAGLMALAGQSRAGHRHRRASTSSSRTHGATSAALAANLEAGGAVSLADGRVTGLDVADMVGGDKAADTIEDIDITATFASLDSPVAAEGNVTWRGTRFAIAAKADGRALLAGQSIPRRLQRLVRPRQVRLQRQRQPRRPRRRQDLAVDRARSATSSPGSASRSRPAAASRPSRSRATSSSPPTASPSRTRTSPSTSRAASAPASSASAASRRSPPASP